MRARISSRVRWKVRTLSQLPILACPRRSLGSRLQEMRSELPLAWVRVEEKGLVSKLSAFQKYPLALSKSWEHSAPKGDDHGRSVSWLDCAEWLLSSICFSDWVLSPLLCCCCCFVLCFFGRTALHVGS